MRGKMLILVQISMIDTSLSFDLSDEKRKGEDIHLISMFKSV